MCHGEIVTTELELLNDLSLAEVSDSFYCHGKAIYADAGVSIDAGNPLIKPICKSTVRSLVWPVGSSLSSRYGLGCVYGWCRNQIKGSSIGWKARDLVNDLIVQGLVGSLEAADVVKGIVENPAVVKQLK